MKTKILIPATVIMISVLLAAGAVVAAPGLTDYKNDSPPENQNIQKSAPDSGNEIQSYSMDMKKTENYGKPHFPLIVLIFGFTMIVAIINYSLKKE
ncbi:hypothetical protein MmiEs2_01300 [Methanimicrococcus stummii]|uniref:Uncharacterized protein n=1 Tax=Methanimicrococcus stummii TaxID=3028294 RepID=A0AA96ZXP6_9EURY|nr:hypothetical protein [Methanimicrococcus sp. Es2]WNY27951.1 hypothetical protein MmiEs2_01300 [Methanimicrococcus sp. Es2]